MDESDYYVIFHLEILSVNSRVRFIKEKMQFIYNGRMFVALSDNDEICFFDIATGQCLQRFQGEQTTRSLPRTFTQDGQSIFSDDLNNRYTCWYIDYIFDVNIKPKRQKKKK